MLFARLTLLLPLLLAPMHSQAGKIVQMAVNDINGCSLGRFRPNQIAAFYCSDFTKTKELENDKWVDAARQKCEIFYETALRTMNTLCSYHRQVNAFSEQSEDPQATQSQKEHFAKTIDLYGQIIYVTEIHQTKLEEYGQRLKSSYESYRVQINQMNGRAGSDEFHEAQCNTDMVGSRAPGYLRLLLAVTSQGNAEISFGSIFTDIREYLKIMKEIKAASKENLDVSKLREKQLNSGVSGKDMVQDLPETTDDRKQTGKLESILLGKAKAYVETTLKKLNPKIGATTTRIVGSGMVLAYKYANNERIDYPEAAASLIGIISSPAGTAADFLVAIGRTYQQNLQEYDKFSNSQLKANLNVSSFELMRLWGHEKKNDACAEKALIQRDICPDVGKQVYDRGPCARNPILQNR